MTSTLGVTPSQTVGPFFWFGLCARPCNELVRDGVRVVGRVLDGADEPVPDAMVEIWQADEAGRYRRDFGWARCGTDDEGRHPPERINDHEAISSNPLRLET